MSVTTASSAATGAVARAVLRDGTAVEMRPMLPSDGRRLVRFHRTLSGDTTYLRFFSFHPELTPDEVHRFTQVDHHDREAVVAVVGGEIVAVARFDRLGGTSTAEVALVVADAWQGRGLGSLLLSHLAERAHHVGIERFIAQMLARNHRMRRVFGRSGYPLVSHAGGGVVDIELDLRAGPATVS